MNALADNDILFKGACFRILVPLVGVEPTEIGVLGAARFVLPKKIQRAQLRGRPDDVARELVLFIESAVELEPTAPEQTLAADLELIAQQAGLQLDPGESQLCAIVVAREIPALLTGDKRAIAAIENLLDMEPRIKSVSGKIRCLEQLVLSLLDRLDMGTVRAAVCGEPAVDKALANCFSCSSASAVPESVLEGLSSYIGSIRADAARVLAPAP